MFCRLLCMSLLAVIWQLLTSFVLNLANVGCCRALCIYPRLFVLSFCRTVLPQSFLTFSLPVARSLNCCCCQVQQRQRHRRKMTKRTRVKRMLRKRAACKRQENERLALKKRGVRSSMTAWDDEPPEVRHGGVGLSRVVTFACLE